MPNLLRPVFHLLSPGGASARLSILIFHRVLAQPDPLFPDEVDAQRFDALCRSIAGWFRVLPLADAVMRLRDGSLPPRAACITFDDGYVDNHDVALPILQRHGLTATFFIATGYLGGGRMFNDSIAEVVRRCALDHLPLSELGMGLPTSLPLKDLPARRQAAETLINAAKYLPGAQRDVFVRQVQKSAQVEHLPGDLMMHTRHVQALHRAGMSIGAHTVSHPILAGLEDDAARNEIQQGKLALEAMLQAQVTLFAYPNGRPRTDYHESSVRLVRDLGFSAAVSTAWGHADRSSDPFQLPRFTPWDRQSLRFGLRLLGNLRHRPQLLDQQR